MLEFEATIDLNESYETLVADAVEYKYFIAQKMSNLKDTRVFLKQIEYNPRKLELTNSSVLSYQVIDKWPLIDADNKPTRIDHGWLLNDENEVQFHFFKYPLQLWHVEPKNLCYDIVPWKANNGLYELKDFCAHSSVNLYPKKFFLIFFLLILN